MDVVYEVHTIDGVRVDNPQHFHQNHPELQAYLATLEEKFKEMTSEDFDLGPIEVHQLPFRISGPHIRWSADFLQHVAGIMPAYMVYSVYTTVSSYGVKSWHLKVSRLQPFLTITGKTSVRYEVHHHYSLRLSKRGYPIMLSFEKGKVRPSNPLSMIDSQSEKPTSTHMLDQVYYQWVKAFVDENPTALNRSPLYDYDEDSYAYCLQLVPYLVDSSIQTPLDLLKASLPLIYRRKDVYRALLSALQRSSYEPVEAYGKIYPLILTLAQHKINAYYLIGSLNYLIELCNRDRYHDLTSLKRVPLRFWQVLLRRVTNGDRTPIYIASDALRFATCRDFDELATDQLSQVSTIVDLHTVCMTLDRRIDQQERQATHRRRRELGERRTLLYAQQINRMVSMNIHPQLIQYAQWSSDRQVESLGFAPEIEYQPGALHQLQQAKELIDQHLAPLGMIARVPQEPAQLILWGDIQGHCVGSVHYQKSLSRGQDIILGIFDEDRLISTLHLIYQRDSPLSEDSSFVIEDWSLSQLASEYNNYKPWHSELAHSLEKEGLQGVDRAFLGIPPQRN